MRKVKKLIYASDCFVYVPDAAGAGNGRQLTLIPNMKVDTNKIQGWPQAADIASDTGILMDADTGAVLFDKAGISSVILPVSPRS